MNKKQRTINTGKRFTTRDLLAQAVYTKELVDQDLQSFLDEGFEADIFTGFSDLINIVSELEGMQESAKGNIPVSTGQVSDQLLETREWLKKAQLKARRGLRYELEKLKEFNFNMTQWNSVPRVMELVPKFIKLHEKYHSELRPHGGGNAFANEGKRVLQALKDIEGFQEITKKNLPDATRELYFNRGLLYDSLRDINAIALEVFMKEPDKASRYNTKILNRGGGTRKVDDSAPGATEVALPVNSTVQEQAS